MNVSTNGDTAIAEEIPWAERGLNRAAVVAWFCRRLPQPRGTEDKL